MTRFSGGLGLVPHFFGWRMIGIGVVAGSIWAGASGAILGARATVWVLDERPGSPQSRLERRQLAELDYQRHAYADRHPVQHRRTRRASISGEK